MGPARRLYAAAIGSLAALYISVRIWNLTSACLWFDEIFSVHAAEHSWDSILSFVALDLIHPPLFYILLKLWISIGGESLLWLRSLPVLFAVIAIVPFVALCRQLRLGAGVQILALFFFAVNGSLIKYAQEVRMYSLLLCLSLFSIWLFARYFDKGKGISVLLLVNVLLVYTHYFGWFVAGAELIAILIFQRMKLRAFAGMIAVLFVTYIPWIFAVTKAAMSGTGLGQNIGWMPRPGASAIAQLKLALVEPFYYAASSSEPLSIYHISVPLLMILTVAMLLYLFDWKRWTGDQHRSFHFLLLFAALPAISAFAASWVLPYSIWGTRHLIILFAPTLILLAIAVLGLPRATVKTGAITMLILFSGYSFALQATREQPAYVWCAWETLSKDLAPTNDNSTVPERLYVFEDLVAYHFWFTLRDQGKYEIAVVTGVDGIDNDPAYFLPRGFDRVGSTDVSQISGDRFWIAFRAPTTFEEAEMPFIGKLPGVPIASLGDLTLEPEKLYKIDADGQTAYVVLMRRRP